MSGRLPAIEPTSARSGENRLSRQRASMWRAAAPETQIRRRTMWSFPVESPWPGRAALLLLHRSRHAIYPAHCRVARWCQSARGSSTSQTAIPPEPRNTFARETQNAWLLLLTEAIRGELVNGKLRPIQNGNELDRHARCLYITSAFKSPRTPPRPWTLLKKYAAA